MHPGGGGRGLHCSMKSAVVRPRFWCVERTLRVVVLHGLTNFPISFDLKTGKRGPQIISKSGCGGFSGSANNLFARKSNPTMFSLEPGDRNGTPLTEVNRPGCWINIIPASGLVSIPESSSGCTCDYPIQTSFVFIPKN